MVYKDVHAVVGIFARGEHDVEQAIAVQVAKVDRRVEVVVRVLALKHKHAAAVVEQHADIRRVDGRDGQVDVAVAIDVADSEFVPPHALGLGVQEHPIAGVAADLEGVGRDDQVEMPVGVDVRESHIPWIGAGAVRLRAHEAPIALVSHHSEAPGVRVAGEHHGIGVSIAIDVAEHDPGVAGRVRQVSTASGERAVARPQEHHDGPVASIHAHQIEHAITIDVRRVEVVAAIRDVTKPPIIESARAITQANQHVAVGHVQFGQVDMPIVVKVRVEHP